MKKITAIVVAAFAVLSLGSCRKVVGDGPVVSEIRSISDYSSIDFGLAGELVFVESTENEVRIEAQRNVIDVIETYVSGGELKIRVRDNTVVRSAERIRITVKGHGVHSFAVGGSGSMQVLGKVSSAYSKMEVSGSGKLVINDIDTDDLEARISGSGSIEAMDGSIQNASLSVSGSGNINILQAASKKATTHTSGSGNIRLNVQDDLEVHISGSGDVYYSGAPAVNVSISGSGRLVKL